MGPWLVQLLDQASLLHHPESHFVHAMVNLFSAIWALVVVGITLNGGLIHLQPGTSSPGQHTPAWHSKLIPVTPAWHLLFTQTRGPCKREQIMQHRPFTQILQKLGCLSKLKEATCVTGPSKPTMASLPVQSAFSNAAPPADMHVKLIKAEVDEQWGGELDDPVLL